MLENREGDLMEVYIALTPPRGFDDGGTNI